MAPTSRLVAYLAQGWLAAITLYTAAAAIAYLIFFTRNSVPVRDIAVIFGWVCVPYAVLSATAARTRTRAAQVVVALTALGVSLPMIPGLSDAFHARESADMFVVGLIVLPGAQLFAMLFVLVVFQAFRLARKGRLVVAAGESGGATGTSTA